MNRTTIFITAAQHESLAKLASETGMRASDHIRRAIDAYLGVKVEPAPKPSASHAEPIAKASPVKAGVKPAVKAAPAPAAEVRWWADVLRQGEGPDFITALTSGEDRESVLRRFNARPDAVASALASQLAVSMKVKRT